MTAITVVIPVYNRASIVRRAIDTALTQGGAGSDCSVEVIIVDDGSSDDLAGALCPYGNRVTCVRHARNSGTASARNTGVSVANSEYVAFLDSDDVWLAGKLQAQLEFIKANGYAASCTAYYLARPGCSDIVSPRYPTGALGLEDLVWGCFVSPGSTLMFERAIFDEIGPFDTTLHRLEDWDWLLRYAQKRKLGFLAQPLVRVEASTYKDAGKVLNSLDLLSAKHANAMSPRNRRHLAAALDLERAAAHNRCGDFVSAVPALLKSLCRSPLRHTALAAILHNRLARS